MIAIVGAGIGGLTAAVALARRHVDCVVYERDTGPPADGAGIQISPNAAAELLDLGLGAAFATAARPVCREIRRWRDNTVIGRTDLRRGPVPYFTLRRSALVRALLAAAGPAVVHDRRCAGVRDEDTRVVLDFDGAPPAAADEVIGADGLHSVVGRALRPDPPRPSGHTAWRAVLPGGRFDRVVVWLGPGRHCVAYPVDEGRHLNLVATAPDGEDLPDGYARWHPEVRELLAEARGWERRRLSDRPPAPRWRRGRITLLGDAAHPILPFTAQGAAQAVEDAVTLAVAPDRYEDLRQPRMRRVGAAARAGLRDYHLPDGAAQQRRDRAIAAAPPDALDWLYGYRASRPRTSDASSTRDASPSFRKI